MKVNTNLLLTVWIVGEDSDKFHLVPHHQDTPPYSSHWIYGWSDEDGDNNTRVLISTKDNELVWMPLAKCRVADVKLSSEFR